MVFLCWQQKHNDDMRKFGIADYDCTAFEDAAYMEGFHVERQSINAHNQTRAWIAQKKA